ncbi:PREDICTED: rho guanine nucleotide exchange factor 10 [Propithecus coquereli]|uniref:rho guanine nucleotide exchange factor 10 n=1 Tax=Propithecus coquereli TaxID=379532 RepID=UPI00063F919B|nr:PREDICTED: rho guanine nucleotide exchange factor 10 [Propithecus coquereli]
MDQRELPPPAPAENEAKHDANNNEEDEGEQFDFDSGDEVPEADRQAPSAPGTGTAAVGAAASPPGGEGGTAADSIAGAEPAQLAVPVKVNPYSVIDISPIQEDPPPTPEGSAEEEGAGLLVPSGYAVPVPCGYAVPSSLPLLLPAYSSPVIVRAASLDGEETPEVTEDHQFNSLSSEDPPNSEDQVGKDDGALARWAADPANTAWMENPEEAIYDDVPRENSDSEPEEMIYDDVENGEEGGNSSLEYGWSSSEFESYEEQSDSEGKSGMPRSFLRGNHKKQLSRDLSRLKEHYERKVRELMASTVGAVELQQLRQKQELKMQKLMKAAREGTKDGLEKTKAAVKRGRSFIRTKSLVSQDHRSCLEEEQNVFIEVDCRHPDAVLTPMPEGLSQQQFSKSMVLDAYSEYVNNFSTAVAVLKKTCATKPAFLEFLKQCQEASPDRITLYSLLMRPIQRFPQFILLLQDLLKNTPKGHPDRLPIQMALTELETLAEKLNERKRDADQRCEIKQIAKAINERYLNKLLSSGNRYLVRSDDMIETVYNDRGEIIKTKERRLFMLNDVLMCATVSSRTLHESRAVPSQRYLLKWSVPLGHVEVIEYGANQGAGEHGRYPVAHPPESLAVGANVKPHKVYMGPGQLYQDLQNLLHDLNVVGQIAQLIGNLRGNYQNLNQSVAHDWTSGLQRLILKKEDEIRAADCCRIQLQLPGKQDKSGRPTFFTAVFNTFTPAIKESWANSLQMAKLALEEENHMGWFCVEDDGNQIKKEKHPLLVGHVPVMVAKQQEFKIECAAYNPEPFLSNESQPDPSSTAHGFLWIGSCTNQMGQIAIVSFQNSSPKVLECFNVESRILCMVHIPAEDTLREPGAASGPETSATRAGEAPTICAGAEEGSISVYKSSQGSKKVRLQHFFTPERSTVMSLAGSPRSLYAGLVDGAVASYARAADGTWNSEPQKVIKLGVLPVRSLLLMEDTLWAASGGQVFIIGVGTLAVESQLEAHQEEGMVISHMAVLRPETRRGKGRPPQAWVEFVLDRTKQHSPPGCGSSAGQAQLRSGGGRVPTAPTPRSAAAPPPPCAVVFDLLLRKRKAQSPASPQAQTQTRSRAEPSAHHPDRNRVREPSAGVRPPLWAAAMWPGALTPEPPPRQETPPRVWRGPEPPESRGGCMRVGGRGSPPHRTGAGGHQRLSVTSLLVGHGLLMVGTSLGVLVALPVPRLQGIPKVTGRGMVSYHAHSGPVKFIILAAALQEKDKDRAGDSLPLGPEPQAEEEKDGPPSEAAASRPSQGDPDAAVWLGDAPGSLTQKSDLSSSSGSLSLSHGSSSLEHRSEDSVVYDLLKDPVSPRGRARRAKKAKASSALVVCGGQGHRRVPGKARQPPREELAPSILVWQVPC